MFINAVPRKNRLPDPGNAQDVSYMQYNLKIITCAMT
jgi:hypothetical protein